MRRSTDVGDSMNTSQASMTRRDLLKRGAAIGGAVLWATPVVQVVGMGRAYAKEVSPNCSRFCLKWDVDANHKTRGLTCTDDGHAHPIWTSEWEELGTHHDRPADTTATADTTAAADSTEATDSTETADDAQHHGGDGGFTPAPVDDHKSSGTVLTCPKDGSNSSRSARQLTSRRNRSFVVYGSEKSGFWVAFPNDVKPAELGDDGLATAAVKCGQATDTFKVSELSLKDDPCLADYRRVFIPDCGNGKDISHIELIVDWCPGT